MACSNNSIIPKFKKEVSRGHYTALRAYGSVGGVTGATDGASVGSLIGSSEGDLDVGRLVGLTLFLLGEAVVLDGNIDGADVRVTVGFRVGRFVLMTAL